jgi:hypothetical protein
MIATKKSLSETKKTTKTTKFRQLNKIKDCMENINLIYKEGRKF